jgi:cell division protein FtsL
MNKPVVTLMVIICVVLAALSYFYARYIDKEEILRVTQEKETLINQRNELEIRVSSIDSAKNAAEEKVFKT